MGRVLRWSWAARGGRNSARSSSLPQLSHRRLFWLDKIRREFGLLVGLLASGLLWWGFGPVAYPTATGSAHGRQVVRSFVPGVWLVFPIANVLAARLRRSWWRRPSRAVVVLCHLGIFRWVEFESEGSPWKVPGVGIDVVFQIKHFREAEKLLDLVWIFVRFRNENPLTLNN